MIRSSGSEASLPRIAMSSNRYVMGELAPADTHGGGRPRKKRRWLRALLIVMMVMFLSVGGCVTVGVMKMRQGAKASVQNDTTLVMRLQGEVPLTSQDGVEALMEMNRTGLSVNTMRRALNKAAQDPKVTQVAIIIDSVRVGFGTVETMREMIHEFRKSDKEVHALIESDSASEADLYLAAAASKVLISPHTTVVFDGLAADVSFYGESLEKLGIKPEVIQFKEYKSAFEPWMGKQMSEPMKRSMQALLANVWQNVLEGIARDRNIEKTKLHAFVQSGMSTAPKAVELGLVDALAYRDELLGDEDKPRLSASKYLNTPLWGLTPSAADPSLPQIALIPASGSIVVDSSNSMMPVQTLSGRALAAKIRKAAKDDQVSAILLWVDSPGGSMVGSDLVWREVQRAKTEYKKPVVVSMASVAASGGYWISMDADAIVAAPSTITGSIGVIFGRMSMEAFLTKLGIHHDVVLEGGPNANMANMWDPLTAEQRSMLEGIIGEGYAQFVQKVANGRNQSVQAIEEVAKGRVWSGKAALAHGLVDRLGGLSTAVSVCKEKLALTQDTQVQLRTYGSSSWWARIVGDDQSIGALAWLGLGVSPKNAAQILDRLNAQIEASATPRAWAWAPSIRLR